MRLLLIGLLLCTACTTLRKERLTFLSNQSVSLDMKEDSIISSSNYVKIVLLNKSDTLKRFDQFETLKYVRYGKYYDAFTDYYSANNDATTSQYTILTFYKKELASIEIAVKSDSQEIYVLKKNIETFYGKKFKPTKAMLTSSLKTNGVYIIFSKNLKTNEARFYILNKKVKVDPSDNRRFD